LTTAIKSTLSCSAAALALVCAACSGPGNTGRTVPGTDPVPDVPSDPNSPMVPLIHKVPWVAGGVSELNEGSIVGSPTVYYPPLATSTVAEFGASSTPLPNGDDSMVTTTPIDCSQSAPYELSSWVSTSEPAEVQAQALMPVPLPPVGEAIRWAGADDITRGSWRGPGYANWYSGLAPSDPSFMVAYPLPWGTPAEEVPPGTVVPGCDGQPNNWVIHMRGAGFRYYGGNIAHILSGENYVTADRGVTDATCPPGSDLCVPLPVQRVVPGPDPSGATQNSIGFPLGPVDPDGTPGVWKQPVLHTYWDVSKYQGIAFWARRGKDSMGTLLITLADKHTSDDMNRQNETFCRRIVQCHSTCQNNQPCTLHEGEASNTGGPIYRCFDPNKGDLPMVQFNAGAASVGGDELDSTYPRCDGHDSQTGALVNSACTFRSDYPDVDFEGKACQPYTFTSGESAEYCFNPGDPPPPSRFERCGDGFTDMVQLSEDWKFYTIPFTELRQGGYGKVSPEGLDLKSAYSITLGWGPGNVDFFIDNVSFYRTKK
jgi:hypothetical protein